MVIRTDGGELSGKSPWLVRLVLMLHDDGEQKVNPGFLNVYVLACMFGRCAGLKHCVGYVCLQWPMQVSVRRGSRGELVHPL